MGSGLRRGLARAAGVAALLALGASAPLLFSSKPPRPARTANPLQLHGRLDCLACALSGHSPRAGLETQLDGARQPAASLANGLATGLLDGPAHGPLHFRDDAGLYWELVPEGAEASALADHALSGREATVFGRAEPDRNAFRVARLQLD